MKIKAITYYLTLEEFTQNLAKETANILTTHSNNSLICGPLTALLSEYYSDLSNQKAYNGVAKVLRSGYADLVVPELNDLEEDVEVTIKVDDEKAFRIYIFEGKDINL